MAMKPHSAPDGAWNTQYENYLNLTQRLEQALPPERDGLERAVAAQQDKLLGMPAPTLDAVRRKLEMLWETELHGLDQASEERRLILVDVAKLIQTQRSLQDA